MPVTGQNISTTDTLPDGRRLTEAAAEAWLPGICFTTGPPGRIGAELEFLLRPADDTRTGPGSGAPGADLIAARAALTDLPLTGTVTVEPGGQIELSTAPADGLDAVLADGHREVTALRREAARYGAALTGPALAPGHTPERLLRHPRYDAMEAWFDRRGPAGRTMMRATTSVQVTVEAGDLDGGPSRTRRRWEVLHAAGPPLVAAFANSPLLSGRPTGWSSNRQRSWLTADPYRTWQPPVGDDESLEQAWTRWCLDAPLMMVRRPSGPWTAPAGVTFRDWIRDGRRAVPDRPGPTRDDLAYHLTTMFPPVRARGPFEVRYLDAQPGDWWQAPVAVVAALTEDDRAADEALDACAGVRGRWAVAARDGMHDPALARAATAVLAATVRALRRQDRAAARVVEAFAEQWTLRGRSPADDLLAGRPTPTAPVPAAVPVLAGVRT
jgi:glutamate--cysteine ligase